MFFGMTTVILKVLKWRCCLLLSNPRSVNTCMTHCPRPDKSRVRGHCPCKAFTKLLMSLRTRCPACADFHMCNIFVSSNQKCRSSSNSFECRTMNNCDAVDPSDCAVSFGLIAVKSQAMYEHMCFRMTSVVTRRLECLRLFLCYRMTLRR